ncbi:MAG: penicillin acylase family protein, partial [Planctomycetota bacterium]
MFNPSVPPAAHTVVRSARCGNLSADRPVNRIVALLLLVTLGCAADAGARQLSPADLLRLPQSLPPTDLTIDVEQLQSEVTIERDDLGVVTLRASNPMDAAFAHGFVHGQDRFFQMDLARRSVTGELAALLGERALDRDL